jgi:hypothetical protein
VVDEEDRVIKSPTLEESVNSDMPSLAAETENERVRRLSLAFVILGLEQTHRVFPLDCM